MFALETSFREGHSQTKNNSHQQLLVLVTMHKGLDLSVCLQKAELEAMGGTSLVVQWFRNPPANAGGVV